MKHREYSAHRKLIKRVLRVAERAEISRTEWDFSRCPTDELFECRAYEFARDTPQMRDDVRNLRKGLTCSFEELVRTLRKQIGRRPLADSLFWYYPEFPDIPYLTIPSDERGRRICALWPPTSSSIVIKPKLGPPPDIGQLLARGRVFYGGGSIEHALFEIDWTESDTYLSHAFSDWLKENRPKDIQVFESRRAGNWTRHWVHDLKALGAKAPYRANGMGKRF